MQESVSPDDITAVKQFASRWPHLGSESSHRWNIFVNRRELEEAGALARRGRRIFLVVPAYMRWMTNAGKAA